MRSRYDNNPGKEASIANVRQKRLQAEHNANNAFVKSAQAKSAPMGGKAPNLTGEAMQFNAYQCNSGEHAQEFGRKLTVGLDKKAFPVK